MQDDTKSGSKTNTPDLAVDPMPAKTPKKPKAPSNYHVSWPVVFVIVVIACIGLVGWSYMANSRLKSQLAAKEELINTKQQEVDKANADRDKAADSLVQATAGSDYVTISEWGVKFKPGTGLDRFLYVVKGGSVVPSTTSLMQMAWDKAPAAPAALDYLCSPASYPLGYITRGKATEKAQIGAADQSPLFKDVPGATKSGDYYYVVVGPQASCANDNSTSDLETKQIASLKDAIKTVVPVQ